MPLLDVACLTCNMQKVITRKYGMKLLLLFVIQKFILE
jgi:hypothetical protein